jgi:hypothetical protein
MISLELAKRLEELWGWRMPLKDFHYIPWDMSNKEWFGTSVYVWGDLLNDPCPGPLVSTLRYIWLPTLSQLLEEVEQRGKQWSLQQLADGYGFQIIFKLGNHWREIRRPANTPEDAVALALISILEVQP